MKRLFLLLLFIPSVFASANLNINSVSYDYLYSNSLTHISFYLENTGDETATLINSNLTGFSNYVIYYSPSTISVGETSQVIFEVSTNCIPPGDAYNFFSNFTYSDSNNNYIVDSNIYEISVRSPFNVSLLPSQNLNIALETTSISKLLYYVSTNGMSVFNFNITVTHGENIYSKVLTSERDYSISQINNHSFSINPGESKLFSHSLIPIMSGGAGTYSVVLKDESCIYNQEIINLDYRVVSSSPSLGFDIMVADESNIFVVISIFFILIFYHQNKHH